MYGFFIKTKKKEPVFFKLFLYICQTVILGKNYENQ